MEESGYASQTYEPGNGGGGASDVRLNGDSLTDIRCCRHGNDQYGDGGGFISRNKQLLERCWWWIRVWRINWLWRKVVVVATMVEEQR